MNLQAARVVLRPRTTSDIMDLGLAWQRQIGGRLFIRLSLILLLPSLVMCVIAKQAFSLGWDDVWVLAVVSTSALEGVFTIACGQLMFAESVKPLAVWQQFRPRLVPYIGMLIVISVLQGLLMLTVIGWILAWPSFLFCREAVLLENVGATDAVRRSHRFVKRDRSRAFGLSLLFLLVTCGLVLVSELLIGATFEFVLQIGRPFGQIEDGGSFAALVGLHLAVPIIAAARFLAYIDLRTRQDGWDIQVKFLAIAGQINAEEASDPRHRAPAYTSGRRVRPKPAVVPEVPDVQDVLGAQEDVAENHATPHAADDVP
ncbi:MAG: hypothetical protein ACI9OJ_002572 [Myxococcota bacterium]